MAEATKSHTLETAKEHFQKTTTADSYEKNANSVSRPISRKIIRDLLASPISADSVVLDNAAGPGITAVEVLNVLPKESWPKKIYATDFSQAMIDNLKAKGIEEIEAEVMDMQKLDFEDATFTHSFCCFAIFALSNAAQGTGEIYRTLQPGGSAYLTTWRELGWAPLVTQAIQRIKPDAPEYTGPLPAVWTKAEKLKDELVAGGFKPDQIQIVDYTQQAPPENWEACLGFVRSPIITGAITRGWTEEEKQKFDEAAADIFSTAEKNGIPVNFTAWIAVATK